MVTHIHNEILSSQNLYGNWGPSASYDTRNNRLEQGPNIGLDMNLQSSDC